MPMVAENTNVATNKKTVLESMERVVRHALLAMLTDFADYCRAAMLLLPLQHKVVREHHRAIIVDQRQLVPLVDKWITHLRIPVEGKMSQVCSRPPLNSHLSTHPCDSLHGAGGLPARVPVLRGAGHLLGTLSRAL